MKKEKNETLHRLDLNATQSPWVVEQCPECGSDVWLKRDEKTGKWKRETGGKMKASWIRGEIAPLEEGKYYVITEAQKDTALYKKGDIVIDYDWYSKILGWMSIQDNGSTWKILAWAEILLPDVPEEINDRLVMYFDKDCPYFEPVWGDELLGRCTQAKAWDYCSNNKTTETAEPQPDGIQFRTVDDLGRICIPMDIRDKLGIKPGTECAVYATDELTSDEIIVIRRNKNDKH